VLVELFFFFDELAGHFFPVNLSEAMNAQFACSCRRWNSSDSISPGLVPKDQQWWLSTKSADKKKGQRSAAPL